MHPKGTQWPITTFAAGLKKNCQRSPEDGVSANGSVGQLWKMRVRKQLTFLIVVNAVAKNATQIML